jgi:hypothetical protein
MAATYPPWKYYPSSARPPAWAAGVVGAFSAGQAQIDSALKLGLNSDAVLAAVRPTLVTLGFDVEAGKKKVDKIRRPVLFGERGAESLAYEVDAFHQGEGIALEIEAGRGVMGNAVYRDLIQTSLLLDAQHLVLAVASEYHYLSSGKPTVSWDYTVSRNILDAIYASGRLRLPFAGVLLIGY